jgi:hypothetical protein
MILKLACGLTLAFVLSACGSQVEDWVKAEARPPLLSKSPVALADAGPSEFVSGGLPYQSTSQGYKISGSVGSIYSGAVQTSPQGYKIYSSVQGSLLSEDTNQQ